MEYFNPNDYWNHADKDQYKGMTDEEKLRAGCWQMVVLLVAVAIGMIVCSFFTSCKSVEYVTVPEVHNEHHWHTDSVHQTDSIIRETQTTIMQLDSAAMARYGIQLKSAERAWLVKTQEMERQIQMLLQLNIQKDSVHDTVPVPVPVIKEVPAELSWWQQLRIHIANILLWALLVVGVWLAVKKFVLHR
jgi:hypothetical protein